MQIHGTLWRSVRPTGFTDEKSSLERIVKPIPNIAADQAMLIQIEW